MGEEEDNESKDEQSSEHENGDAAAAAAVLDYTPKGRDKLEATGAASDKSLRPGQHANVSVDQPKEQRTRSGSMSDDKVEKNNDGKIDEHENGDIATVAEGVRASDRLRRKPRRSDGTLLYYKPSIFRPNDRVYMSKLERAAASDMTLRTRANKTHAHTKTHKHTITVATNLRRSTRKRKMSKNLEDYTDSSGTNDGEDDDLMRPAYRRSYYKRRGLSSEPKNKKTMIELPRREGLRPRYSKEDTRELENFESDSEESNSEDNIEDAEAKNPNEADDNEMDNGEGEDEGEDDGENEGDEEGDDEDGEEQEGRRRYDLRNRAEVRRLSVNEGNQIARSPRRVLHQGSGTKLNRDVRKGGSRVHKRQRFTRAEDSDDSLLVDELDQGSATPWGRGEGRSGAPWLFGGPDMHGTAAWGLNMAASGWVHQSDALTTLTSGVQTAGPSSKGGADIQPLQIDQNVSFDEIGGLSEYIDALKEMVFFPLLYPDFFSSYHITPPRGVLLCGPPGTGKTLIARALACAASKAGQKVSFYMRKGADVLSKWVGEAERQLKLLFEEAQRNQPSIIFFDEIDGLAPVRSSKQEQIHNSIVSTLLALMDGLDSRGQVVLIGATNRIDAIDGALRRPGRFDREFTFPLPGCDARAEILDIHTRKWKQPPPKELKLELAASCVGYCGADLKALCTEAAIRAFREKYPQVYTSDDKFLIDVDSVKVEKNHFVEAMSTITPAAHRGSVVNSRPLSSVVAPCLQAHLQKAMNFISDILPALSISSKFTKLSMLSYGSVISLTYRPRILLCGKEGVGLEHLGPAILHELEKFPVHSLGLSSLLSDPSAKTPEEALVHIFGEARRTAPSILYLPQFHIWWENAHDQLKAVLVTLLEETPPDLPILLLGTCTNPAPLDNEAESIFSHRNMCEVDKPSTQERLLFLEHLISVALSISSEDMIEKSKKADPCPDLPKAPKVEGGPKASELRAKIEAEQHSLRRLRMCLRDVCNRVLYDKRFSAFHYPVMDEDAPNYHSIVQNPMEISTLLQRVDSGQYTTCTAFVQDVDLIVNNAKAYNGNDYNGARIVSRAYELRDAVLGMLSQMDPALVTFCEKMAAEGGPTQVPDDLGGFIIIPPPVVQLATVTRASARLRNVQPEVTLDQSCGALKRPRKNADASQAASADDTLRGQESIPASSPQLAESSKTIPESCPAEGATPESFEGTPTTNVSKIQDVIIPDVEISSQLESIKLRFLNLTEGYGVPQLERLYTRIMKGVFSCTDSSLENHSKPSILRFLLNFVDDVANF